MVSTVSFDVLLHSGFLGCHLVLMDTFKDDFLRFFYTFKDDFLLFYTFLRTTFCAL